MCVNEKTDEADEADTSHMNMQQCNSIRLVRQQITLQKLHQWTD